MLTKTIKYFILVALMLTTPEYIQSAPLKDKVIDSKTLSRTRLQDAMFSYSEIPWLNQKIQINLEETQIQRNKYSKLTWSVITEPQGSQLKLFLSEDKRQVSLTAKIAGEYKIKVVNEHGEHIETEFTIVKEFPFEINKLDDYNRSKNISEISAIVTNQFWVYAKPLNEDRLRKVLIKYKNIKVIGYDDINGLLIELNVDNLRSKVIIKKLLLEKSIDRVDKRVYRGKNFMHEVIKIPDDGSAFDDGGDNWHLEYINMDKAWDISTGSDEFYVGVSDGGNYAMNHEDLSGRFKEILLNISLSEDHGTMVSGAIVAIADNGKGITGINWITKAIATLNGYSNLKNLIKRDKVLLVNNSWVMSGYVDDTFNPNDSTQSERRIEYAFERSSDFLKLVDKYSNKLFIWGAGNGVGNGKSQSGVFGVDGKYENPALYYNTRGELEKKDNVIFVAALTNDKKLAHYSAYGESLDIAAPTGFKSTIPDNKYLVGNNYGEAGIIAMFGGVGFSGTSAAAPVVTGVASLIYSVDTSFTAAEVKKILIKSASRFVTQRYTDPFGENTKILRHKIPIVDAGAALKMAKEIKEGTRDRNTMEYRAFWDRWDGIECNCKELPYFILSFLYLLGLIYKGKFCRNQRIKGVQRINDMEIEIPKQRLSTYVPWWQLFIPYKAEWIHYHGMTFIAPRTCNAIYLSKKTQVGVVIEGNSASIIGRDNIKIHSGSLIELGNEEYFLS